MGPSNTGNDDNCRCHAQFLFLEVEDTPKCNNMHLLRTMNKRLAAHAGGDIIKFSDNPVECNVDRNNFLDMYKQPDMVYRRLDTQTTAVLPDQ